MNICSMGLVCPVGLSSAPACAAMRAGISAFGELPYWDSENDTVIGAAVPGLDGLQFGERLIGLLVPALKECLSSAQGTQWSEVPLVVGLPEPTRPGVGSNVAREIIPRIEAALKVRFHPGLSQVVPHGHTAGFEGLGIARRLIDARTVSECLVCGVDSYLSASTLQWLDACNRLKRAGNSDGLIPGEAAAVVHLRREPTADSVQVVGLGYGQEAAPLMSGQPLLGRGLAEAAGDALNQAKWGFHDLDFRMADITGESYGFREHTLAEARLVTKVRKEPQPLWHAAEFIGDTGAASGLVQLAWLTTAMNRGYAPGPRALCFSSGLAGRRASAACSSPRSVPVRWG